MDPSRRRQHVGPQASAALPTLWKEIERSGMEHSEFAKRVGLSSPSAWKLRYGVRQPGRSVAVRIVQLFPRVRLLLWDKPCPPNWRPHNTARARPRRAELPATGTG